MYCTWNIVAAVKSCCALSACLVLVGSVLVGSVEAGLIQHLDANVVSSVETTGVVVDQWLDQSGSGNNAVGAGRARIGSPTYPSVNTSGSGLQGVDLGDNRNGFRLFTATEQDAFLDFAGAASGNSGFAVLVAFRVDSILGGGASTIRDTVFVNHGNAATANSFGLRYEGGKPDFFALGSATDHSGPAVAPGDTVVLGFNYLAATGAYEFFSSTDGATDIGLIAANANFSSTQPLWLGTSDNNAQYMDGMVGEVQVYNMHLSEAEFASQAGALVDKWVVPEPAACVLLALTAIPGVSCLLRRRGSVSITRRG